MLEFVLNPSVNRKSSKGNKEAPKSVRSDQSRFKEVFTNLENIATSDKEQHVQKLSG